MAIIGIDFASVDGNKAVDFQAAKAAGVRFVIMRAIYGRSLDNTGQPYRDPTWERYADAVKAAGLKRGAYLFLCFPRTNMVTPTPEQQVQAFVDYVKLTKVSDFVPFLDVEEASTAITADQMYDLVLRAAKALKTAYGVWPAIYTSNRVWQENLKGHAAGDLISCPLWLAKPWPWPVDSAAQLDGAPSYNPTTIPQFGDDTVWWVYQYQGDGLGVPGFSSTVDMNRFHVVRRGDQGGIVRWVQRRAGVAVDGVFGSKTEAGVKAVQAQYGLAQDGIVGPDTFAALAWTAV